MYVSQDVAPKAKAKLFHLFAPSMRNSHCSSHKQSVNVFKTHVEVRNRDWIWEQGIYRDCLEILSGVD